MDLHNHYLRFSTVNISLLQTINKSISIHHLIQSYNYEMTKEELDVDKLEFCRLLLCYEYQSVFCNIERSDKKHKKHAIPVDAEELNFPSIEMIFPLNFSRSISQISLLCDIINLRMILYYNISSIKQYLQNFLYSNDMYTATSNSRIMYMRILEYLLEFLHLYQLHTTNKDSKELESLGHIYFKIIKSWLKLKEDCEWRQFALMFPKLVGIFTPSCIVFPLWNHFLYEISDLKESLGGLSIMADICFMPSNSMNYIQCDIYCNNTFWLFVLRGLRSPLQQYRKQALYIMKKAIGSMSTNVILNFESQLNVTKAEIIPFICNNSDTSLSINDIKEKFFLLYEALEEKKEHLITPTLIHAAALIKINKEHRACNCFNIVWLQCIFEKILLHENNHIVKWGISYVCKLDKTMFDDRFLELFIHVLNNNFLYECQSDEKCPGIVKELSQFLEYAEKSNLLNRFLKKISYVAWGPVAIFYIIHVLRTISHHGSRHSDWQTTELNAIKFLVETNLSMHSRILRTASQTELLRTIPNYVRKINNLPLLANVLATFPSGESLTRGTVPWNVITTWLEKVLVREDVITFIKETCAKYLNQDASPEINPRTFAIMVYLLYDANLIFLCQTCPDVEALNNWLYTLNGINVRPYADVISTMNVVEFISHLLYLSPKGESHNNMTDFISLHIRITFNFLIKNMRKMSTELSYEDYTRYTAIVSSHIVNAPFLMSKKDVNIYAEKLQNESINLIHDLQNLNIQYLYGLHTLYLSQNMLTLPLTKTFYIKRLLNTRMNIHNDINEEKILKGKMASEYDLLLLKLLHQYLINSLVSSWYPITIILSNLLQFLEVGLPENVSEIAKILTVINDSKIINDASDKETLEYIFNLSFTYIINSKRNNIFWTAIEDLMGVIINNNFLLLLNAIQFTKRYVVKLLNEGENTPRFKRILLSKMKNLDIHNLMKLENVLGNCFLHGSVYRRDKKIENYAHLFIEKQLDKYYSKHIFTLDHNNDAAIRAEAVILLHRIISNPEFNYAASFGQSVLNELIKNKTKRYFKDSPLHKLKHRIMQILLILEPVLSKEFVPVLQEQLCDFIFSESNQSSVKIMQEWLLIRIFTKNIHLHDKLWSLFAKSIKDRPRCTISVASIVYHVAKLLSRDNQRIFIQTAMPYIVQCCLGQQFNARVYNQFILTQLYELMKANYGDNSISEYRGIYQAAVIGLQQESLIKNSSRIQDDFYFSNFHPFNDYCLQTIYYQLPRLTNVSCDEWISPDVFKNLMFIENDCHPLQLCNTGSFLTKSTPSIYLTKSFAGDTHGDSLENNVEIYMEGLNDIQKKIDPSKPIGLCGDIFEVINEFMFLQDTQSQEGLIVVASFVNRPPNLGGIARTCEIFGVKALVVANADCVKDKEFQYLSVSADKWLNILQVKPYELQKFLLDRKNIGWSLIGVEQTVNSTNLMTTTFEKRTILVLGNEKDGIPANFIPLFDKCVEIPQVGVTRSLNVHVTAAICIWQYANQHVLK